MKKKYWKINFFFIKLLLISNIIARCNKFFKKHKYEIKRKKIFKFISSAQR